MYSAVYKTDMPRSSSVANARARLAEIVNEVERGADVEITRRGRKVALVVSAARFARLTGERLAFTAAYQQFRMRHDLQRNGLAPGWAAELRDRDPGRGRLICHHVLLGD
jgi:prevent-host-death family protein